MKTIKYCLLSLCVAALSFLGSANFVYADSTDPILNCTLFYKYTDASSMEDTDVQFSIDGQTYAPNYNFNMGIIPSSLTIEISNFKTATYQLTFDDLSCHVGFEQYGFYFNFSDAYVIDSNNNNINIFSAITKTASQKIIENYSYTYSETNLKPWMYDIEIQRSFNQGDKLYLKFTCDQSHVAYMNNYQNMCLVGDYPCLRNGSTFLESGGNWYYFLQVASQGNHVFSTLTKINNAAYAFKFSKDNFSLSNGVNSTYLNNIFYVQSGALSSSTNLVCYDDNTDINNLTNYFSQNIDNFDYDFNAYITWTAMYYGDSTGAGASNGPSGDPNGGGDNPSGGGSGDSLTVNEVIQAIESAQNLNDMENLLNHIDADIHTLQSAITTILSNTQNLGLITNILTAVQSNETLLNSILTNVININSKVELIYNYLIGNANMEEASQAQDTVDDAVSDMNEHADAVSVSTMAPDDIVDSVDDILENVDTDAQSNIYSPLFLNNSGNIILTVLLMALTLSILSYALYGGQ